MFKTIKYWFERVDAKNRTIFGHLTHQASMEFLSTASRCNFLLQLIVDHDIKSGLIRNQLLVVDSIKNEILYSNRDSTAWKLELEFCIAIYQAQVMLGFIIEDFESQSLELDPYWTQRLESFNLAAAKLFDYLTLEDKERLFSVMETMHTEVAIALTSQKDKLYVLKHPEDYYPK